MPKVPPLGPRTPIPASPPKYLGPNSRFTASSYKLKTPTKSVKIKSVRKQKNMSAKGR